MPRQSRLFLLDELRGLAVVLMVIFHFCYDLSLYGLLAFPLDSAAVIGLRTVILALFFCAVGAGLYLAHTPRLAWRKLLWRQSKIGLGALLISLTTLWLYPTSWIWFGVLHFIFLASWLALPWLRVPRVAACCGCLIFALYYGTDWFHLGYLWQLFSVPLHLPRSTQDLTRLIPWFGFVLIGLYLGHQRFWHLQQLVPIGINPALRWVGQHSLLIYLVHQPPLVGLAWLLSMLSSSH